MSFSLVMIYILLEVTNSPNPQVIAHCRDTEGVLVFTDPPCPQNSIPVEWRSNNMSVIELKTPKHAQRTPNQAATKRAKRTKQTRPTKLDRKQECQRTRSELKQLRADRRRGYRLTDAAKLDAKLDQLKSDKRRFC